MHYLTMTMTELFTIFILGLLELTNSQEHHDICDELMLVNCKTEALPGSRIYRDNHGKTYENFCLYSQAKCRDKSIDIESICTCQHPNIVDQQIPNVQSSPSTTEKHISNPSFTVTSTFVPKPITNIQSSPSTTENNISIPSFTVTSTFFPKPITNIQSSPSTTENNISSPPVVKSLLPTIDPIKQVFCKSKDNVVCPVQKQQVCGSDGKTYSTGCSFNKAQCEDPGIYIAREGPC